MLKWIRRTALVVAGAVMTLGCVRGLAAARLVRPMAGLRELRSWGQAT